MGNSNSALRQLTVVETAKALRKDLRATFPGTKFSVRMARGTSHGSLDVSWAAGPEATEVEEKVSRRYEGKSFDGQTDSTNYVACVLSVNGEDVIGGAGYIMLQRERPEAA